MRKSSSSFLSSPAECSKLEGYKGCGKG